MTRCSLTYGTICYLFWSSIGAIVFLVRCVSFLDYLVWVEPCHWELDWLRFDQGVGHSYQNENKPFSFLRLRLGKQAAACSWNRALKEVRIFWKQQQCMYDSGRPYSGDVHGMDSRLGQGERSLKTYFPNPAGKSLCHSRQDVLTLMCFLSQLCCWRLRVSWRPIWYR